MGAIATDVGEPRGIASLRQMLALAGFGGIVGSRTSKTFGTVFTPVALELAAVRLGDGVPLVVSAILFASFLPSIFVGPPVAALVEGWDKRRTMLWAQLLLGAALLLVTVSATVPMFVAVAFLMGIADVFYRPAYRALLPEIAAGSDLHVRATGLVSALEKVGSLVAIALGTYLVLGVGVRRAFVLDALVVAVSGLCLLGVPARLSGVAPGQAPTGIWRGMREGFLAALERPLAREILLGAGLVGFGMTMVNPLLVLIPRDLLHAPVWWFGVFEFAQYAAMAVLGGLIASGLRVPRRLLILGGFLLCGVTAAALGVGRSPILDVAIYIVFGVGNMAWLSPVLALYRLEFPLSLRARGGSVYSMLVGGIGPALGVGLGGVIATATSIETALVVAGLWMALVAGAALTFGLLRSADRPAEAAATSAPA
jgi:MFS family permease